MASCALLSLPEELLAWIASFLQVEIIINFALACKTTHHHVETDLQRHRQYYDLHRICHDRLPLTTPTLLRLAIEDPDAAWQIRTLEFWGARPSFEKWKTWADFRYLHEEEEEEKADWPEPREDYSTYDEAFFKDGEIETYERLMTQDLRLPSTDVEEWMDKLKNGWDEPLKGMLVALSPKLQSQLHCVRVPSSACIEPTDEEIDTIPGSLAAITTHIL